MRIKLSTILIALVIWDFASSPAGESAVERAYEALAPVMERFSAEALETGAQLYDNVKAKRARAEPDVPKSNGDAEEEKISQAQAAHTGGEDASGAPDSSESAPSEEAPADELNTPAAAPDSGQAPSAQASADPVDPAAHNSGSLYAKVKQAATVTASSLGFLLHLGAMESGFNVRAVAPTSTAAGPFQFVEQTWLGMIYRYGPEHGLAEYAGSITRKSDSYSVVTPERRQEILDLRHNPEIAALMAGHLARENHKILRIRLKREPTEGDLYAAHVLGPWGAVKLIKAVHESPKQKASDLFPQAARANQWLFVKSNGEARRIDEFYAHLTRYTAPAQFAQVCHRAVPRLGEQNSSVEPTG